MSSAGIGENLQDEVLDDIKYIQNLGQEAVLMCNINIKLLLVFLLSCASSCFFSILCAILATWGVGAGRAYL